MIKRFLLGAAAPALLVMVACTGEDPVPASASSRDAGAADASELPDAGTGQDAEADVDAGPPAPTGRARWMKPILAPAGAFALPVRAAAGPQGSVAVVGTLIGAGTFDFGDGQTLVVAGGAGNEGFIAKYDASGTCLWARLAAGAGDEAFAAVAVGPSGEVVAIGSSDSPTTTISSVPVNRPGGSAGHNILLAKIDAAGTLAWHRVFGGPGWDEGEAVAVAANGDVLLGARVVTNGAAVAFDSVSVIEAAAPSQIGAVVLLDKDAKGRWARGLPQSGGAVAGDIVAVSSVAFDPLGDVIAGGWFDPSVSLRPNPPITMTASSDDGFVVKLARDSGATSWGKQVGGAAQDRVEAVTADALGNVYLAGIYTGPGVVAFGSTNLPVFGGVDVFVAKLDPSGGTYAWARGFGVPASGSKDTTRDLALDPQGNVVLGGSQDQSIPWSGVTSTGPGGGDTYVVKLDPDAQKGLWAHGLGSAGADLAIGSTAVSNATGTVFAVGALAGNANLAGQPFSPSDAGAQNGFVLSLDP